MQGKVSTMDRVVIEREDGVSLYAIGNADLLGDVARVGIVGAAKATSYGIDVAKRLVAALAGEGCAVVTGGARGIETAVLESAIAEGVPAVAFLAGGLAEPYPHVNDELFERLLSGGGLLLSEQVWGAAPMPWMFRARRANMVSLCAALIVAECGVPSGVFSQCDHATELGVPVYAVPGNITSPASAGCNALIADGAARCLTGVEMMDSIAAYARRVGCSMHVRN